MLNLTTSDEITYPPSTSMLVKAVVLTVIFGILYYFRPLLTDNVNYEPLKVGQQCYMLYELYGTS